MRAQRRTTRSQRRSSTETERPAEIGVAVSITRLAVGAVSLGSESLARQVGRLSNDTEAQPKIETGADGASRLNLGDLGAGLAVESVLAAGRLFSVAAGRGRRTAATVGRAGRLPIVSMLTRPARRRLRRYEAALLRLSKRGRREEREGRRMVERLIREATARSFTDIAEFAINEVTHSPEVAELVKTQSTGIATDTILEVRTNSARADDQLESRVHSWLHIRKPDSPHGADRILDPGV